MSTLRHNTTRVTDGAPVAGNGRHRTEEPEPGMVHSERLR
jgi:hypothetical protein